MIKPPSKHSIEIQLIIEERRDQKKKRCISCSLFIAPLIYQTKPNPSKTTDFSTEMAAARESQQRRILLCKHQSSITQVFPTAFN